MLTFKCKIKPAPSYLIDLLFKYKNGRQLQFANAGKMFITRSCTVQVQDPSFRTVAPHIWNKLPTKVTHAENVEAFKTNLKIYHFNLPCHLDYWLLFRCPMCSAPKLTLSKEKVLHKCCNCIQS